MQPFIILSDHTYRHRRSGALGLLPFRDGDDVFYCSFDSEVPPGVCQPQHSGRLEELNECWHKGRELPEEVNNSQAGQSSTQGSGVGNLPLECVLCLTCHRGLGALANGELPYPSCKEEKKRISRDR